MSRTRLQLKQTAGWFAAGREVASALALLSDSAFKLYIWLCLNAERSRGWLSATPAEIARTLGKTEADTAHAFAELIEKQVCREIEGSGIEILDRFWPYHRAHNHGQEASLYVEQIKRLFLGRGCVRSAFPPADERLAMQLHSNSVPIGRVERAIWLGCLRKYATLLNHGGGPPITTLHYFTGLFSEVERLESEMSPRYSIYVAQKLRTLEQRWDEKRPLRMSARVERK